MYKAIKIHPLDDVAMVLQHTPSGTELQVLDADMNPVAAVATVSDIPFGHKVCTNPVSKGGLVKKFGAVIGRATSDITPGEHVHVHNVISIEGSEKVVKRREV